MKLLKPIEELNDAYKPVRPTDNEMEIFLNAKDVLLNDINIEKDEEHNKNFIAPFLRSFSYPRDRYKINTDGKIDLAISKNGKVEVLFEVKRPYSAKNKVSEMVKVGDMNQKALQEALLYYMRQIDPKNRDEINLSVKNIVITNATEWFIIKSHYFNKLSDNTNIRLAYKEIDKERTASSTSTDAFYKQVERIIKNEDLLKDLKYVHIDLSKKYSDIQWRGIYKLLTPRHLLQELGANDSNTLNKKFYNELLHIIGLEEVGTGKKLIQRKSKSNRDTGSLLENTIRKLETEFGISDENELFEKALELNITWLNRILFLKLLDSHLHSIQPDSYKYFIGPNSIDNYDVLNTLFFEVLSIKIEDRKKDITKKFGNIPYLNSSLFEPTILEKKYLRISGLKDDATIDIFSPTKTQLDKTKPKNTLQYLMKFLDAYDFSSDPSKILKTDSDSIINASVLGLIFEKINGYKDGSFFTPGFITMYMTKETIRKSVVEKFNEAFGIEAESIEEIGTYLKASNLHYKVKDIENSNKIINQITILDPAVGSGHFLVSALNEIICIKSELGLLSELNSYIISNIDDELLILDGNEEEIFKYTVNAKGKITDKKQKVQKYIFHEKQRIIENQLFGVDINPNSVKITQLRLWIELLKHSYYDDNGELVTLPNIDINIKCGNSLISKYPLKDSETKNKILKDKINSYKSLVKNYIGEKNKITKKEIEDKIEQLKKGFKEGLHEFSPEVVKFQKTLKEYVSTYRYDKLSEDLILIAVKKKYGVQPEFFADDKTIKNAKVKTKTKTLDKLEKMYLVIKAFENNKIYENSFEWRFEFPAVLNEEGDFIGFDIVIGNPPYISSKLMNEKYKKTREYLKNNYVFLNGKWDMYIAFLEKSLAISNNHKAICMIVPNAFVREHYSDELRNYLISNKLIQYINFYEFKVFDNATVRNIILKLNSKTNDKPIQRVYQTPTIFAERSAEVKNIFKSQNDNTLNRLLKSNIYLGDICFISKGMVLNSHQKHTENKFVKAELISEIAITTNFKNYTEGKWINNYLIEPLANSISTII